MLQTNIIWPWFVDLAPEICKGMRSAAMHAFLVFGAPVSGRFLDEVICHNRKLMSISETWRVFILGTSMHMWLVY